MKVRPAREAQSSFFHSTNSSRTAAIKHHKCSYHSPLLEGEGNGNSGLLRICLIGQSSAVNRSYLAGPPATVVYIKQV